MMKNTIFTKGLAMSDLEDPRVLFAAERTLLAWNRTSLSLIAFGFVVEHTGLLLQTFAPGAVHAMQLVFTFWLGIAFILLGSFASAYSARQYAIVLRTLSPAEFPANYAVKWGFIVNMIVAFLGVLLAFALINWHYISRL